MRIGRVKGFTLVEMIVAIVIAASLGLTVYTTFAQGVRLWTRASKDRGEWKVDLWVEKMIADLRNAFQDPKWPLKGTRTELFFAALVHGSSRKGPEVFPAYFRYAFDPNVKAVASQKYAFEDVLASSSVAKASGSVLSKVAAFELEYYSYDDKLKTYRWESRWNKDCFPEAVKITIEPEQTSHRKWIRMISMPTGSVCPA